MRYRWFVRFIFCSKRRVYASVDLRPITRSDATTLVLKCDQPCFRMRPPRELNATTLLSHATTLIFWTHKHLFGRILNGHAKAE